MTLERRSRYRLLTPVIARREFRKIFARCLEGVAEIMLQQLNIAKAKGLNVKVSSPLEVTKLREH